MGLRKRFIGLEPWAQIRIGLAFLILASLSNWFLEPGARLSDAWTDGVTGLLYGVSIGCMLLGIWRNGRTARSSG